MSGAPKIGTPVADIVEGQLIFGVVVEKYPGPNQDVYRVVWSYDMTDSWFPEEIIFDIHQLFREEVDGT